MVAALPLAKVDAVEMLAASPVSFSVAAVCLTPPPVEEAELSQTDCVECFRRGAQRSLVGERPPVHPVSVAAVVKGPGVSATVLV